MAKKAPVKAKPKASRIKAVRKPTRAKQSLAPKVAEAVGTSVVSTTSGPLSDLAARMEAAMTKAVEDALADGVPMSDVETIKARKMAAREAVLAQG